MSKIKKLALGFGIAAGFSAAILPMATYAEEITATDTLDINVNIATVISMRLESHSAAGTKTTTCDSTQVVIDENTGDIVDNGCTGDVQEVRTTLLPNSTDNSSMYTNIYVSTNSGDGYMLTLKDSDNNTNLQTTSGSTIATIASEPLGGTNPGWAILVDGESSWQAMPAGSSTAIVVKNYTPNPKATVTDDMSKVTYGVATSSDQDTGVYSDTVVYTATSNS